MSILITNIKQLIGLHPKDKTILKGAEMAQLPILDNAWLLIEGDNIANFGVMNELPAQLATGNRQLTTINASGKIVMPGYVDSHTHIVYAGSREAEFVDRIKGLSYEEIAQRGGGILNSAKRLNETSENDLFNQAWKRLEEVKHLGTTSVEIKSGYGLSVEGELKMLRVIRRLKEKSPMTIKATFLAAHAYPMAYRENHEGYLRLIEEEMLPIIAQEKLADYIDAFCEKGFFSEAETERVLKAGARYGLKAKIHANQLNYSGGIQTGVKNKAISVDHLECVGEEELKCLLSADTIGTLLPSAAFFINLPYQPARKMIDAGLGIALASDYNPGSSPSGNMNFVLSLACTQLKMLPEEAINAATLNGAYALELSHTTGSIAIGKRADLLITASIPSYAYLPYSFGSKLIEQVIIAGIPQN